MYYKLNMYIYLLWCVVGRDGVRVIWCWSFPSNKVQTTDVGVFVHILDGKSFSGAGSDPSLTLLSITGRLCKGYKCYPCHILSFSFIPIVTGT